jgi:hypothetical protein
MANASGGVITWNLDVDDHSFKAKLARGAGHR